MTAIPFKMILASILLLASIGARAAVSSQENKEKLQFLEANRVASLWTCSQGALQLFQVTDSAAEVFWSKTILSVKDEKMCAQLHVTCPFVSSAFESSFGIVNAKYAYWATRGKAEDTLLFFSDQAGMKLVHIFNGSQPSPNWDATWYFNPDDCVKN